MGTRTAVPTDPGRALCFALLVAPV